MSTNHQDRQPNALIHEKSPYLLQHAYNPVHWMPWSEAAFTKAANEDKPIFLSIGYSTCHWWRVQEILHYDVNQKLRSTFLYCFPEKMKFGLKRGLLESSSVHNRNEHTSKP